MANVTRKVLWCALALLIALVVAGAVFAWPYLRMPPESTEELDAKFAVYQAEAREMENRPKEGRQALDALIKDLEKVLPRDEKKELQRGCPFYDPSRYAEFETRVRELQPFFDRFDAMTKNGFVLQQDAAVDSEIPHFNPVRRLIDWELTATVLDVKEGRDGDAVRRLEATIRFADGLLRTPSFIGVFTGIAIVEKAERALVHNLPRLSPEEADRARSILRNLPDSRVLFVRAMRVETASFFGAIDRILSDPDYDVRNLFMISDRQKRFVAPAFAIARKLGYLTRERYMHLSVATREIAAMETWAADPTEGAYESPIRFEDIKYSFLLRIGYANYSSLAATVNKEMKRRAALVRALDLELKRRGTPEGATWEIPFDDRTKLVRKPEYGCLIETGQK